MPNLVETVLRTLWSLTVYWPRQALKWALIASGVAGRLGRSFRNPPDLRPRTHGAYAGLRAELAGSRMAIWDGIFREAGLEIVRRYTLSYEAYVSFLIPRLTLPTQRLLFGPTLRIGATPLGVWLGPSYGLVARSDSR